MRYQKDIAIAAKASNDDLLRRTTQRNINKLQANYEKISEKAGLIPDKNRMAVAGFRKVKTAEELKNPAKYGIINIEQKREWLKTGYDKAVNKGDLSALTGFEHYENVAHDLDRELVNTTTTDGIVITGYKTHFIDRIIGSYAIHREPVSISYVKDALLNGKVTQKRPRNGKPSNAYTTEHCSVSVNPTDGTLIQATPKEAKK